MPNMTIWFSILIVLTVLLLLRLIDFIDEAVRMNFHMTRIGFNIHGHDAMLLQLLFIAVISFGVFKAAKELKRPKPI